MKFQIIFLLLLSFVAFSQVPQIDIDVEGACREFDITVRAAVEDCWDVKIDVAGVVLHPDGWKSSFFYINNALCENEAQLKIRLDSKNDMIASLKLRQNETIVEKNFELNQNCSEPSGRESLFVVLTIIIILAAGIAIYLKKPKKKQIRKKKGNPKHKKYLGDEA